MIKREWTEDLELELDMARARLLAMTRSPEERRKAKLRFAAEATRAEFGRARGRRTKP